MLAITLITEVTYLLSVRLASFRWQELYLGLFTELGKLHSNVKRNDRQEQPGDRISKCCAVADWPVVVMKCL